jgi:3-dehydroquinate dehydratase-2|tara:strand:+ start:297 stop:737 length:441 start_codon:yes stop_codon:yes gene_type:complete
MSIILVINGPNLNLLGTREPEVYGDKSLDQINQELTNIATKNGCILEACQSNSESELVNIIQNKSEITDYMIINPGAFTHTSIALRDVLLAVNVPFIEVHISNIFSREEFRKNSYFSDIAQGTISGLGFKGYELALLSAIDYLPKK